MKIFVHKISNHIFDNIFSLYWYHCECRNCNGVEGSHCNSCGLREHSFVCYNYSMRNPDEAAKLIGYEVKNI